MKEIDSRAKAIWIDSIIDIPVNVEEGHFNSLQYLTGQGSDMDISSDVVFVGPK